MKEILTVRVEFKFNNYNGLDPKSQSKLLQFRNNLFQKSYVLEPTSGQRTLRELKLYKYT